MRTSVIGPSAAGGLHLGLVNPILRLTLHRPLPRGLISKDRRRRPCPSVFLRFAQPLSTRTALRTRPRPEPRPGPRPKFAPAPDSRTIQTSSTMASDTFVLEEYGGVPVKAPGLTKDQLKQWPPFKVSRRSMPQRCLRPTASPASHARW